MCKDCGCEQALARSVGHAHPHPHPHPAASAAHAAHGHDPDHGHPHPHPHEHEHEHEHEHSAGAGGESHTIALETRLLARNDELARRNREWLQQRGIVAINLISSPGSGKTFLLERTLERLRGRIPCAVITGDQQTDNDARRLMNKGAPVHQIETVSSCHLDAHMVGHALATVVQPDTRLLFIENVGNLVCPAAFDLGETFKVALLSVTEGEDKPAKYPVLFTQAPVIVLTKTDLIPHLDWKLEICRDHLRRIHPGAYVFELSARTGEGMDAWIEYLARLVR